MAVAEEPLTYLSEETWVSKYIREGGNILDVTGLVKPKFPYLAANYDNITPNKNLPRLFDWRWMAEGLQPIRNQKNCGSCWAFSTTATFEAVIRIQSGKFLDLSEQAVVSCSRAGSCMGGYFEALNYMSTPGVPDESQFPYKAQSLKCKSGLTAADKLVKWSYIGDGNSAPTTEQLKTAIYEHGPISVTVCGSGAIQNYKTGIYNSCSNSCENHMVNLEGWNDDGQYWIMRNSWGETWGENGYGRIKYTNSAGKKCNSLGYTAAYITYNGGNLLSAAESLVKTHLAKATGELAGEVIANGGNHFSTLKK